MQIGWVILRSRRVFVASVIVSATALAILLLQRPIPRIEAHGRVDFCTGSLPSGCRQSHPAEGLVVQFQDASLLGRSYQTTTKVDGTFTIALPAGRYAVLYPACRTYALWPNAIEDIRAGWYESRLIDSNGVCELGGIAQ